MSRSLTLFCSVVGALAPTSAAAEGPRGYWIVSNDITDARGHDAYIAASRAVIARCGGVYIIRGGRQSLVEGRARSRHVVIMFSDYATALACHQSEEYARASKLRSGATIGDTVVVEGVAP